MEIKAVKFRKDGFYTQAMAFGGEEGMDKYDHPTVYCGTHTPQGYEYVCSICGYVYDPAEHDGVAFEDLPDDWKCPRCRQGKDKFNKA